MTATVASSEPTPQGAARRPRQHPPAITFLTFLARRLGLAVPLLFVVTFLSFLLVSLTPGDAAQSILGERATPEQLRALRQALGLDQSLYEQYTAWAGHAIRGDFGSSLFTHESVTAVLNERLPVTVSLLGGALVLMVVVGVAFGVTSAVRGGVLGRVIDAFGLVGFAVPAFWIGAILIAVFAVHFGWVAPTGYVDFNDSPRLWAQSLVLPVVALSLSGVAAVAKHTREAMLDSMASEYIRMAWASGIAPWSIVLRHTLKNASPRIATIVGLQAVGLLGGTVAIETVFALPGLGSLAVNAVLQHDIPMIQGIVAYFTIAVVSVNLLVDLSYSWLNPRVSIK